MEMENSGALSIVNRFIISLYKVSTHVLSVYLYSSHSNVSGIVGGGGIATNIVLGLWGTLIMN